MFGVFGLLNLLIGSVYPLVASYKAYDSYSLLATKTGATTFNVGGVSIPLGTILKKATSGDNAIEEDTLNSRLLSVQMWLIYWMVNASVSTAESLLGLSWLPFYSTLRCGLSLWLIAPILVSSARLKNAKSLSFNDVQREWGLFSNTGCGLVYFQYLRPFFAENIGLLNRVSFESLLTSISVKVVLPLMQQFGLLALFAAPNTPQGPQGPQDGSATNYSDMFSGYTQPFKRSPASGPGPELNSSVYGDMSEYDVVDKPSSEDLGVRNREPGKEAAAGEQAGQPAAGGRRPSWHW